MLAQTGMVVFGALLGFCVTLFEEATDFGAERRIDRLKMFGAWLAVFAGLYYVAARRMDPEAV